MNISSVTNQQIADAAAKYGLDFADLYGLLKSESNLQNLPPRRVLIRGQWHSVTGVGQILDDTAVTMGIDPTDPDANLDSSAKLFAQKIAQNNGNIEKAVQQYKGIATPDSPKNLSIMERWKKLTREGADLAESKGFGFSDVGKSLIGKSGSGGDDNSDSLLARLKTPEFLGLIFVVVFLGAFSLYNLANYVPTAIQENLS